MKSEFSRIKYVCLALAFFGVVMLGASGAAQQTGGMPSDDALVLYLRKYLTNPKMGPDTTTRISPRSIRLRNGSSAAWLVYVTGYGWCGTGGCTLLVLEPDSSLFRVIGRTTIAQLPIRVFSTMTNGHPDIGVRVRGELRHPSYEAVLRFDGTSYPAYPSGPQAARASGSVPGEIIFKDTDVGKLLYK